MKFIFHWIVLTGFFCLFSSVVLSLWDALTSPVLPVGQAVKEYAYEK